MSATNATPPPNAIEVSRPGTPSAASSRTRRLARNQKKNTPDRTIR